MLLLDYNWTTINLSVHSFPDYLFFVSLYVWGAIITNHYFLRKQLAIILKPSIHLYVAEKYSQNK